MRKSPTILALMCMTSVYAQDSLRSIQLDEIAVFSTRANEKSPTTYSFFSKDDIATRNLGQDLPIVLNFSPSMVTTSDAGGGVGYTGMRIRGSDATRINVSVNGIPLNDSESHGVFWVNMPDFASSLNSIQIQRGVGTSSNGAAAFGATVNLKTSNASTNAFVQTDNSFGNFNTWKSNVTFNSGLLNSNYNFEARLSKIASDGYVDRSASDLKSYYLSGGRFGERTMIKFILFGGQEITQQAWYGTPEALLIGGDEEIQNVIDFGGEYSTQTQLRNLRKGNRRFNYYLYENEVDNYRQDHYQAHVGHTFSNNLNFAGALHYTKGRGFFEQFRSDDNFANYGLQDVVIGAQTISSSDFIRRRWLDNDFYGFTYALNYSKEKVDASFGGGYNIYDGDHFGKIIWAEYAGDSQSGDRYYDGNGVKKDFNSYLKINYQIADALNLFGDAQFRVINYETAGLDSDRAVYDVDQGYNFFNPKLGITYELSENTNLYASYAIANREPVRSDFIDASAGAVPKPETLHNLEIGVRSGSNLFAYSANFYFMNYKNQLVLTGAVNDVGSTVRINVPKSYRAGIELVGTYKISDVISWSANMTLSQNEIDQFTEVVFDHGAAFDEFNVVEIEHSDSDISFSPKLIVGSDLQYSPFSGMTIQLFTKYVGKQFLDNTSDESRSIKSYLTNDIRMAYEFSLRDVKRVEISLMVNNVLAEEYESNGYTWGYFYGENLYQQNNYYPQAKTNFLSGLSVRF